MNDQLIQLLSQQMAVNSGNPDISTMMMQMLQEMRAKEQSREVAHEKDTPQLERRLRQSKQMIQSLEAELELAGEFIAQLADFVGACAVCFGMSKVQVGDHLEDCPQCHGRYGGPGSRSPDPRLPKWIEPALRRLDSRDHNKRNTTTKQRRVIK